MTLIKKQTENLTSKKGRAVCASVILNANVNENLNGTG